MIVDIWEYDKAGFAGIVSMRQRTRDVLVEYNLNKYSENAKSCKALVIMYVNTSILFTFS